MAVHGGDSIAGVALRWTPLIRATDRFTMAVPIDVSTGPGGPGPEAGLPVATKDIVGRSLGQIAWLRLRRDKVAMGGGIIVVILILIAIIGPHVVQNPDIYHAALIDPTYLRPIGSFGGISLAHPLGVEPETGRGVLGRVVVGAQYSLLIAFLATPLRPIGSFGGISLAHPLGVEPETGRDVLARIVVGAQYSLLIAFLATALAVTIGTFFGVIAGYFGGWVDAIIARAMDVFLAFPLLVFALALAGVIPSTAFGLSGNSLRIAVLIFVIGFFNWPYMGRIIRGQTLSLREREFVDAARSLGARGPYILFRELLPNLFAPMLVYATLLIPTNILFEAALDYLGVGLYVPTPTWGQMLSSAVTNGYYYIDPEYMLVPGIAIFITVMAFNLFGDGLRDALDPRTR